MVLLAWARLIRITTSNLGGSFQARVVVTHSLDDITFRVLACFAYKTTAFTFRFTRSHWLAFCYKRSSGVHLCHVAAAQ